MHEIVAIVLSLLFCHLGTGIVARVDTTRTGSPSIYHVNCEMLVTRGNHRCSCSKKHRKLLCAIATRDQKDDKTNPSSHTNYSCLTSTEKDV